MKTKQFFALALACVCAVAVGCSKGPKKPADLPPLYPATITVVYDDGTPVDQATVALRPAGGGNAQWNVTGVTHAQGKLVCKTNGNWDGAPAGSYEAMVTKEIIVSEDSTEPGASPTIKSRTRYVDLRYANPKTSGLTAEVKEGDNQIELKVGEKIEEEIEVAET